MKKIEFRFVTFTSTLIFSSIFSWNLGVIIVFFIVFVYRIVTGNYEQKVKIKESFFFWLNFFIAAIAGVGAFYLIFYLKSLIG